MTEATDPHPPATAGARRLLGGILLLLAIVPALPWCLDLPYFGALQYNDYYGVTARVLDGDTFTPEPQRWLLLKSNEHTVTLPALAYAANYFLTGGDNRGLSAFAILLGVACALLAGAMVARALRLGVAGRAAVTFVAAALWFTPAAVHSYVMGFSGAIWILANAFTVAAMWAMVRVAPDAPAWRLLPAVGFGCLGAISYTTNMSLWPALLLGAVAGGRRLGQVAILLVGSAAVFTMQYLLRARPEHHPKPNFEGTSLLSFVGGYLGWPATGGAETGRYVAFVGLAVVGAGIVWALAVRRHERARAAVPFVMLAVYGLGNALGTGVGRSAWGLKAAEASRYVSLAASFWLGALGLCWWLATAVRDRVHRGLPAPSLAARTGPAAATAVCTTALLAALWVHGVPVRHHYLDQASWHPVAELALRHGVLADTDTLRRVNSAPEQFAAVPWLLTMEHVPFDRPLPVPGRTVVAAEAIAADPHPSVEGSTDQLVPIQPGVARLHAWAVAKGRHRIVELVVLDQDRVVRGELAHGVVRTDVQNSATGGRGSTSRAWRYCGVAGYVFDVGATDRLRVYVRLPGDLRYYPLPGELTGDTGQKG